MRASLAEYHAYLQENAEKLTHWAGTIVLKAKEGSAPKAQSRFAAAQVPRGHVDPAAQQLDDAVDEGFGRIEKAIFGEESTAGTVATAKQLRAGAEALQQQLDAADPPPARIIAGAGEVLAGVLGSDLTGQAEPYSDTELTVVAAKLEGVDAAIAAAKPLLKEEDPELLAKYEYYPALRHLLETSRNFPVFTYTPQFVEVLGRELSLAVTGEKDPQAALATTDQEFADLLRKDDKLKD